MFRGPLRDPDFSPPELKRAVVSSMLRDGDAIPSSAYANRTLAFTVKVERSSENLLAEALRDLHRELDRERNVLEYKPDGATKSVFFRTFRSPQYDLDIDEDPALGRAFVTLALLAEPFAYGTRETLISATDIDNDPASVGNAMFYDLSGILGDVPTPAQILVEDASAVSLLLGLALRVRGQPGNLTHVRQAEAMTQGTDTATQPNDAAMSGAGNNFSRITFATNNLTTARLTLANFLGSVGVDIRGTYRLFARVRRNGGAATDDYELRAQLGRTGGTITVSNLTGPQLVDLGLFAAGDVVSDGYGAEIAVTSPTFVLNAQRTAGTGDLDIDYILALPADAAYCQVDFAANIGATDIGVLDGPQDAVYRTAAAGGWLKAGYALVGGIPELVPNQTNRLYVVRSRSATDDRVADDLNLTVRYWPRYLYTRPA